MNNCGCDSGYDCAFTIKVLLILILGLISIVAPLSVFFIVSSHKAAEKINQCVTQEDIKSSEQACNQEVRYWIDAQEATYQNLKICNKGLRTALGLKEP